MTDEPAYEAKMTAASARRPHTTPAAAPNLDAKAWVDAALDAMAEGGVDAVRVDPIAKRLGVTRGSFYWHFKDHDALLIAILKAWRAGATYQLRARIESKGGPARLALKRLLALPYSSPRSARGAAIELAMRLWARRDPRAARAVRVIDRIRLDYFASLLEQHGAPAKDARGRAMLFYAYLMAEAIIAVDKKDQDVLADCERLLLEA